MSQENVEIVKAAFEAWNAGDMDALRDLCDPHVIVRPAEGPEGLEPTVVESRSCAGLGECARPGTPTERKQSPTSSTLATELL